MGELIIKCPVIDEKTPETCVALDGAKFTQETAPPHNSDCKCFAVAIKRRNKDERHD